jgi:halogenation protein CepH
MPLRDDDRYDLIIVGGGPGGSTIASCVQMRGHRTLLLERARFPRYQIGESLLPATMGICKLIGVLDEVESAGFNPKNGGEWYWGEKPAWQFAFSEASSSVAPAAGRFTKALKPLVGKYWAYQVERMKFDDILLRNARRLGAEVREGCGVKELIQDEGRVSGVVYTDEDGREHVVRARMVADASGNTSTFHQYVGERRMAPRFRNLALFGYWRGGHRNAPPGQGSITVVTFPGGWFWYIPLSDTLTSLGAVISVDDAHKLKQGHERAMNEFIESCPKVKSMLANAERITDGIYGELRVRKDWSYCNTEFWKPGICLVGDSACFVDPLFSSGVHLATYAGLLGARSINSMLDGTVPEERGFREYQERYRNEYFRFYRFLTTMYDVGRDKEDYFRKAHDHVDHGDANMSDKQAFVKLVSGFGADATAGEFIQRETNRLAGMEVAMPSMNKNMADPYAAADAGLPPSLADADIGLLLTLGEAAPIPSPLGNGLIATPDGLGWRGP